MFFSCFFLVSKTTNAQTCYQLMWSDEFNGTTLNTTNWTNDVGGGGWGNSELEYYTSGMANMAMSGGTLKIIAKREVLGSNNYTSARIITKNKVDYKYGKFEARIKMPPGRGLWPAFWMLPTDDFYGTWPRSGEIDIMEFLGHQPTIAYGTLHAAVGATGTDFYLSASYTTPTATPNFTQDFHVFSAEWSPNLIKFFIDGNLYATRTAANFGTNTYPFDKRFFMILNLAVGGAWPGSPDATTVFPANLEVDYVRVYQKIQDFSIVGATTTEPNVNVNYSLQNLPAGVTVNWSLSNGTIISGQNTRQMTAIFAADNQVTVTATVLDACNNTTAVLQLPVNVTSNRLVNPEFEDNLTNWITQAYSGAAATFTISTVNPQKNTKALDVNVTTTGDQPWYVQVTRNNLNLQAGQTYKISFWAKANQNNRPFNLSIINQATYNLIASRAFNLTTQWQEYTYLFTPNATQTAQFNVDLAQQAGIYSFDNFFFGLPPIPVATADLDEKNSEKIDVFPNPTHGIIQVKNADLITDLAIYNVLGTLVLKTNQANQLDLTHLPNGIYTIKAVYNGVVVSQKIIKN